MPVQPCDPQLLEAAQAPGLERSQEVKQLCKVRGQGVKPAATSPKGSFNNIAHRSWQRD